MSLKDTIQSQYANSPVLLELIQGYCDAVNQGALIESFKRDVWCVETANSYGLDIWGIILGINRNIRIADPGDTFFGFTDGFTPFNDAPFYAPNAQFGSYKLSDEAFRFLIKIKIAVNICKATAPEINKILQFIFKDRGDVRYIITGVMKARYNFDFIMSELERKIVFDLGLLPHPCGVLIEYFEMDSSNLFGFFGTGYQPFNQGTFYVNS